MITQAFGLLRRRPLFAGGIFTLCVVAFIAFALRSAWLSQPVAGTPTASIAAGRGCVGERVSLTLGPNALPYLNLRIGPKQGWFLLDTGYDVSVIDLHAYDQPRPNIFMRLPGSSLPTVESVWAFTKDLSWARGPKDEPVLGVIGSDILGGRTVEIQLDTEKPYLTLSNERCPSSFFKERGLRPIDQSGYFASHWWRPYTARWSGPNNLVAFVRIGGIETPAMIDTGFDGSSRAVDINEALLERLRRQGVAVKPAGSATYAGCTGEQQTGTFWTVDAPLSITTEAGEPIRIFGPPPLLMKPANHRDCGWGIGNAAEPWAQIGMHQLLELGAVVIDGPNNKVWLPQERGSASPLPPFSAVSLAWNASGDWQIVRSRTETVANADALKGCSRRSNGRSACEIAASLKTALFGCVAVAWNKKGPKFQRNLSAAASGSFVAARNDAMQACRQAPEAACEITNTICND